MKVCYFIQTHKNPEQIYRLVRTIKRSSPTAGIVIGHDFTSCSLDITPLQDLEDIHLLKIEFRAIRGDFSLLQPYLMAIDWLVETKFEFDWLVYLSGQDYPTQTPSIFEAFLATTNYDGFIRYWDVFSPQSPWRKEKALRRYYCQYYRLPDSMQNVLEFISKTIKSFKLEKVVPMQFFLTYGSLIGFQSRSHPLMKILNVMEDRNGIRFQDDVLSISESSLKIIQSWLYIIKKRWFLMNLLFNPY